MANQVFAGLGLVVRVSSVLSLISMRKFFKRNAVSYALVAGTLACLALGSLLIALAWAVSLRWVTGYGREYALSDGSFRCWQLTFEYGACYWNSFGPGCDGLEIHPCSLPVRIDWRPLFEVRPFPEFGLPLWIPFLLVAIPTGILFWRDRRTPPGHCQRCRYDLTGNTSGICPECGENT